MRIAYIQSIGGASGDMLLSALLDLGLPLEALQGELAKLGLDGYELTATLETRREVRGTKLSVNILDRTRYSPRALLDCIAQSSLPAEIKEKCEKTLSALWQAESRVHGEPQQALELEELGSIDTLVDVVGVAVGLWHLGVRQVYAAPLVLGAPSPPRWPGGYSNPAPATLELVAMYGAPVAADLPVFQGAGELTTPTGAAIIASMATFERPAMSVTGVGVGLGTRDPENFPNVVRVWLGETAAASVARLQGNIVLLETNMDDVTGETLGYAQERLFALGALDVWYTPVQMKKNRPGVVFSALVPQSLDVWYTPVQMKKNRPGVVFSALVPQSLEGEAVALILRETPTLGIRTRPVERYVAERENVPLETDLGIISVKVKSLEGKAVSVSPEFEDCRRVALETGLPLQEVYQRAEAEARRRLL
jgi:uncharacterized protein (TIGR00299 family) protein